MRPRRSAGSRPASSASGANCASQVLRSEPQSPGGKGRVGPTTGLLPDSSCTTLRLRSGAVKRLRLGRRERRVLGGDELLVGLEQQPRRRQVEECRFAPRRGTGPGRGRSRPRGCRARAGSGWRRPSPSRARACGGQSTSSNDHDERALLGVRGRDAEPEVAVGKLEAHPQPGRPQQTGSIRSSAAASSSEPSSAALNSSSPLHQTTLFPNRVSANRTASSSGWPLAEAQRKAEPRLTRFS